MEDSKGAADVFDSWARSMMKKLDPNQFKFSPFIICKVHTDIRKDDPGAYTPKIVSIGPFHRREENVQAMEELKRHYLNNILPSDDGNKERCLTKCLKQMKEMEHFVRICYHEKIDMDPQEFVEMMLVDGCFLIQLLFQEQNEIKIEDPIYNNYWRLPLIALDILLLENQLPFVVLEELCPLLGKKKDDLWKQALNFYKHLLPKEDNVPKEDILWKRALNFCKHLLPKEDNVPKEEDNVLKKDNVEREKPKQIYHLLHLIHMYFNPSPPSGQQSPREAPQIRGAAQSTVCGSVWISAQTMGHRSPTPLGEQSAQELQHTLAAEQSSLEAYSRSGEHQFVASGSAPTYSVTRPPASQGKQSLQELKHSPSSNIFSELSGSSPIYPSTECHTPLAGSAPINPKTEGCRPPGLPGKQSSQELQHTQSGQQSFEDLSVKMSMAAESFISTSSQAYPVTTHLRPPISPGEQSSQDPAEEDDPFADIPSSKQSFGLSVGMSAAEASSILIEDEITVLQQDTHSGQQYTLEVTRAPPVGASGNRQSKQDPQQPRPKTIPSVTELEEAGLTFQLKKVNNFLNVTIKEGKLEMPRLCIDDSTNSLFRNFIAFEQCFPKCGRHFTSYCFFMDSLVNTAKDVGILRRKGVIENLLGSDDDVAVLFNKLCRGVFINFYDRFLNKVVKKIDEHTKKWWPRRRAELMRDYFNNPWSMLSVAAASLIIVLTLVQTIFTVFA